MGSHVTTFEAELEHEKSEKIAEVAARGATIAHELGQDPDRVQQFLRHYFRHVDAADVDERSVEDMLGTRRESLPARPAAPGRPRDHRDPDPDRGPGRVVGRRGQRGADRHRRPALPRRLGHDGDAPPGVEHPGDLPPAVPGPPRPRRDPAGDLDRSGCQARTRRHPRVVDVSGGAAAGHPGGSEHRRARRRARVRAAGGAAVGGGGGLGLAQDADPGPRDDRPAQRSQPDRRPDRRGGPGPRSARVADRPPLHLPRLPRVPAGRPGRQRELRAGAGHRVGHAARRPGLTGRVPGAASEGPGG